LLDVFAHTLEDPNDDGAIDGSFVNRSAADARRTGEDRELRAGLTSVLGELEDKFLRPTREAARRHQLARSIDRLIRGNPRDLRRGTALDPGAIRVDIEIIDFLKICTATS
jgi:hypothetical protein